MITIPPTDRPVLPTETVLITFPTQSWVRLLAEVKNEDPSQTLDVYVWRRSQTGADFSQTTIPDLLSIQPGETKSVDLDVTAAYEIELRGQASGIGLTAQVSGIVK